ncbi:hypothetical protein HPTD01_3529 [Halomonas sp. TD01]|nr:hypothetical protein HPTD01_3529 [Halomonas sp. TD01]
MTRQSGDLPTMLINRARRLGQLFYLVEHAAHHARECT